MLGRVVAVSLIISTAAFTGDALFCDLFIPFIIFFPQDIAMDVLDDRLSIWQL